MNECRQMLLQERLLVEHPHTQVSSWDDVLSERVQKAFKKQALQMDWMPLKIIIFVNK